jgi:hypothetical protein
MEKLTALQYIKRELGLSAKDFMAQWKTLTKQDQEDMKNWAIEEAPEQIKKA